MGIFENTPQMPNPMGYVQQFRKFCQDFQGDPQQKAQELLNSGRMTQEQFSQLNQMYQMFGQFFK